MAMTETCAPASADWAQECLRMQRQAVGDLAELVCGPADGQPPRPISDPILWVHRAFDRYRAALPDNDRRIPALARLEHDFIAALCALNFDDQMKQLRSALDAMQAFAR
jgi:hypothetical protein